MATPSFIFKWWSHAPMLTCIDNPMVLCSYSLMIACSHAHMHWYSHVWYPHTCAYTCIMICLYAWRLKWSYDWKFVRWNALMIMLKCWDDCAVRVMCTWVLKYSYACMFTCLYALMLTCLYTLMLNCLHVYLSVTPS